MGGLPGQKYIDLVCFNYFLTDSSPLRMPWGETTFPDTKRPLAFPLDQYGAWEDPSSVHQFDAIPALTAPELTVIDHGDGAIYDPSGGGDNFLYYWVCNDPLSPIFTGGRLRFSFKLDIYWDEILPHALYAFIDTVRVEDGAGGWKPFVDIRGALPLWARIDAV